MRRRPFHLRLRHIVLLCTSAVMVAALIILLAASSAVKSAERSQQAAERWGADSDMSYAQISVFISSDAGYTPESVRSLRNTIDKSLESASITLADGGVRLWYDAYSTEGKASVSCDYGKADVNVTAVGGDFFIMHELQFLAGWSFSPDDLMQDRVVLDGESAWALYGSYDIAGKYINIAGKPFVVAGVVQRGSGSVYEDAYGAKPRIYMPYEAYTAIYGSASISCYEAVLPDQISGFAMGLIKDNIGIDEAERELIENSARYDFIPLCGTISGLAIRSMRTNRIIYPYWENVAGVTEDKLALLQLFELIIAVVLFAVIFISAVKFLTTRRLSKEQLEDMKDKFDKGISDTAGKLFKSKK